MPGNTVPAVGRRRAMPPPATHLPGEPGIWIFVLGELTVFTLLFGLFLTARVADRAGFAAAQAQLHPVLGLVNSIILIVSSWLVALALRTFRTGDRARSARLARLAMLCGLAFLAIKSFEYYTYLRPGPAVFALDMFMYYFAMTGLHFAHVIIAVTLIGLYAAKIGTGQPCSANFIECSAVYWHMMDIIWLILFTVFYII